MAEKDHSTSSKDETTPELEEEKAAPPSVAAEAVQPVPEGGGGWGGWGLSLSYLSDLQKAASVAAEEISRNAVEVAKTAAKGLSDMAEDSDSSKEDNKEERLPKEESEGKDDERRKASLEKLEKASEDSFLGQGIKVFDSTVENFASGAWQALGNALRGGSDLVQKLENSAGVTSGSVTPSLIETGRAFTSKGMEVLELVGKETLDLLSIEVDKKGKESDGNTDDDQLSEEVTFDRCFYIYGGSEQLEELEALSNHFSLLFTRRKAKMTSEQKSFYDGKFKEVQRTFDLSSQIEGSGVGSEKGKKVGTGSEDGMDEMKKLYDSSISKAAELAAGFENALAGLGPNDIIQRTASRLDSLHSEGVHRLSEMCCYAVTHLLMLGKSVISNANKDQDQDAGDVIMKIDWPEDFVERAKIIRTKAESMSRNMEEVSNSFITGISDVAEACMSAMKGATKDSNDISQDPIQEKANTFSQNIRTDHITAVSKLQDGVQFLAYVVLSTSVPAA